MTSFGMQIQNQYVRKLVASDATGPTSSQGRSVCVSEDASFVVVGGETDHGGRGAAWVFGRTATMPQSGEIKCEWEQCCAKLTAVDQVGNAEFGHSVAMSSNASLVAVGAPGDRRGQGCVVLFERNAHDRAWVQRDHKFVCSGAIGAARQGHSVALSADGRVLATGAPGHAAGGGAVFVRHLIAGRWTDGITLQPHANDSAAACAFGTSVALSADGHTLVVGAPNGAHNSGSTYVFTLSSNSWQERVRLLSDEQPASFALHGTSVAVSADGLTVASGGTARKQSQGSTMVWSTSRADWSRVDHSQLVVGVGGRQPTTQGASVALRADGRVLAVGAPSDDGSVGSVFVFARGHAGWEQRERLSSTADMMGTNASQGSSVAFSSSGQTLAVGAISDATFTGATWMYCSSS